MTITQKKFFHCSLPIFSSIGVYEGVRKMVEAYPQTDEEVIRRRWLGTYYRGFKGSQAELRYISTAIGSGVFAKEFIAAEKLIGQYTGLVKKRRWLTSHRRDYVGEYNIPGNPVKYIIDAEKYGSLMRFINHSDEANVYALTVIFKTILQIYIIAKIDISPGEQLLMDYGPDYWQWRFRPAVLNENFT